MAKGGKSDISKNARVGQRGKGSAKFYNGKKVEPIRIISNGKIICHGVKFSDSGDLLKDSIGGYTPWAFISGDIITQ